MQERMSKVLIVSNFKNLDQALVDGPTINHEYIGDGAGVSLWQFMRSCLRADLVILNVDQRRLVLACMIKWLLPMTSFKLISVDLILRPPKSQKDRLKALARKKVFSRVDRFILYFKNLSGYERFYGIGPERAVYVPFKVNGWERIGDQSNAIGEDYVLCAGRTLRDIETFIKAMEQVGYPGVLLQQRKEFLMAHGTSAWVGQLPPNVRLIVDDSDSLESFYDFIGKSRLVVIPRFCGDIAATGISTYLVAMALRKCVVLSQGPGAEDILDGEAVIVPPENVDRLAEQIELLWNNQELRSEIAASGRRYAESVGGEQRLLSDILRESILCMR
jgi:glycosyltransferase involved in cell wall biosynthesis